MKKKHKKIIVSAVILSYNRKNELKETIERLLSYKIDFLEIIVVDNASIDGTQDMIKNMYADVKLIELEENIGVSAYNIGFEKAKGEYILILDDDSFPEKEAILKMVDKFKEDEKIGIIALDVRNYYYHQKKDKKRESLNRSEYEYVLGFNGAGAGFRKSVFLEVGGYPDEFFLYFNELDLSIRVLNAGYKIAWLSGAIVLHKFSFKNRSSRRAPFFYTRNLFWIAIKYFSLKRLLPFLLKLIFLSIFHSIEQRTTVYIEALFSSAIKSYKPLSKRVKVKEEVINKLKITEKLAFTVYDR